MSLDDFTLWKSRGSAFSSTRPWAIFLYPNSSAARSKMNDYARYGALETLDQIYEGTSVDYYEIFLHDFNMNLSDSDADSNYSLYQATRSYCNGNNPRNADYSQWVGVHVGISDLYTGGANYSSANGFTSFVPVAQGIKGSGSGFKKQTTGHEACHTIINAQLGCTPVEDSDHDVGKRRSDGKATLMASGYADHATHGSCSSPSGRALTGYVTDMTSCALTAIDCNADNTF